MNASPDPKPETITETPSVTVVYDGSIQYGCCRDCFGDEDLQQSVRRRIGEKWTLSTMHTNAINQEAFADCKIELVETGQWMTMNYPFHGISMETWHPLPFGIGNPFFDDVTHDVYYDRFDDDETVISVTLPRENVWCTPGCQGSREVATHMFRPNSEFKFSFDSPHDAVAFMQFMQTVEYGDVVFHNCGIWGRGGCV